MDLLPSLECLGPLTHGRAPSLALDLMLGTRLIARGYANHTLKSRAHQLAERHAAAWRARIASQRNSRHFCRQTAAGPRNERRIIAVAARCFSRTALYARRASRQQHRS